MKNQAKIKIIDRKTRRSVEKYTALRREVKEKSEEKRIMEVQEMK